ncbi:MAG: D-alanyl-D-alanine carboxypeptidase [Ruminococcaceae bacterium]|nr:D-alanyl-D-alanine carboxypeptidase [Oscillospiraceae bacterium]
MKKKLIFCISLILCVILCASSIPFSAYSYECPVDVTSSAVLVANLETDTFVYERNISKKRYLSYLANIMTFIVARSIVSDVDEKVKIEQDVLDRIPNSDDTLDKYAGRTLTIKDLLHFIMLTDGHDASYVLANHVSGTVSSFVRLMNKKARDLGCKGTKFVAPSCVQDKTQYTNCNDMYKIIKCALDTPDYIEIASTTHYQPDGYKKKSLAVSNTNSLLRENSPYYFKHVKNGKYATDSVARGNIVAVSEYSDVSYVCIVLGAQVVSEHNAFTETKQLLTWAYTSLDNKKIVSEDDVVATVTAGSSWGDTTIELITGKDIEKTLPADYDPKKLSFKYDSAKKVELPVFEGQNMGTADVCYDSKPFETIDLISNSAEGISMLEDLSSLASAMIDKTLIEPTDAPTEVETKAVAKASAKSKKSSQKTSTQSETTSE